jgi:hypothetical protein
MSIFKFVVPVACLLAFSVAPARSAEVSTPDDTARYLAGLQPSAESPLAKLAQNPNWQQHVKYFDGIFAQNEKLHLSPIREFSKARLTSPRETMFYMFAGPDALHAVAFFPEASTYVLSGLEPAGDIPPLTGLSPGTLYGSLRNLAVSMRTLLTLSFFRTKDMKSELRSGPIYGTLPLISVFLVRSSKTIHEISFVNIDNEGVVRPASEAGVKSNAKGVKVVFSGGKDARKQTLYYFSTDLSDSGLKSSGFLAFCNKLGAGDSFVKSASYLMHGGNFVTVRKFLLENSALILQDDSGVPLGYFDPKKWQFQPLGRYLGPIEIFPGRHQPQMSELFRKGNPIPLPFGIGYRWRKNESNMLLATRIAESKPEAKPESRPEPAPELKPGLKPDPESKPN